MKSTRQTPTPLVKGPAWWVPPSTRSYSLAGLWSCNTFVLINTLDKQTKTMYNADWYRTIRGFQFLKNKYGI